MVKDRDFERQKAVEAVKACKGDVGLASKMISRKKSYVQRWWDVYKATHDVSDKPRSGRPPKLSKFAARKARTLALSRVKSTCNKIADALHGSGATKARVSRLTINRALHRGRKKLVYGGQTKVKALPAAIRKKRLEFCRMHNSRAWRKVLVLDSKVFPLNDKGHVKEWHCVGTMKKSPSIADKRKLHAYAGACVHGVTKMRFVTGTTGYKEKYYNRKGKLLEGVGHKEFIDVLKDTIIPEGKRLFGGTKFVILMDKAPAHTPVEVYQALDEEGIDYIPGWPGNSPDLNWIENLWGIVGNNLMGRQFRSLHSWKVSVEHEWTSITKGTLKRCVQGMRDRMRLCIERKGDHTGY